MKYMKTVRTGITAILSMLLLLWVPQVAVAVGVITTEKGTEDAIETAIDLSDLESISITSNINVETSLGECNDFASSFKKQADVDVEVTDDSADGRIVCEIVVSDMTVEQFNSLYPNKILTTDDDSATFKIGFFHGGEIMKDSGISLEITMPGTIEKVPESAEEKSSTTLFFDDKALSIIQPDLTIKSDLSGGSGIGLIIVLVVLVLVLVGAGVGIALYMKKKSQQPTPGAYPGGYPPQGGPGGYPPQGQPGMRQQGQPSGPGGYPPQGQPGVPPQGGPAGASGYPSQGQPGMPPQGQPGVPGSEIPPQGHSGMRPQGQPGGPGGYPSQGQPGMPPQGQPSGPGGYPPQGQPGVPPQGGPAGASGYPSQGQPGVPPQGQPGVPPQGRPGGPGGFPPRGNRSGQ